MKLTSITLGIATAAAIFIAGCATSQKTISEESLGLRKTDLYTEQSTVASKTMYKQATPGTSERIERSYENAPPMIPHSVEGMLPITINNNSCTQCHLPGIAESMNATPIPKTHFTNYRPDTKLDKKGDIIKDGKIVKNTTDLKLAKEKKLATLSGARFNCSQCHAPQSEGQLVKNNFKPDFREAGSKNSSHLFKDMDEGVK
ncbi:nitrate reductase cytochrome c-type subunit [Arcobacter sp. CECT 8985]|uniref:nitrate reductase cytochrome c-type subunit n=1 Tax=Arcobacter sp. CECT 8985 TaxID=1935424 RepID=UPI00100ADFC2|nr:nitrate reductase cytochrome c-type subunit [Arcobacter sp. CECT 8985]RXJ86272.1 nitrate reductase [Arcobacter sp. CECT 8985]